MVQTKKAKVLFYDIEVSRDIVGGYGPKYDFRVVKTYKHQELMCFSYKWQGGKIKHVSRHDDGYSAMVAKLWELLDEADIAIAHNGNKFDHKMANRFFVKEGLPPVNPYKSIDTLQVARSTFKFQSNSLNDIAEYLGLGSKKKITYADLEDDFLDKPTPKIKKLMREYNDNDVKLLEMIYDVLRPYIKNHPNMGDILQEIGICPKCASPNLRAYGTAPRANGRVQTYICNDCGGRSSDATIKGKGRIVNA